MKKLLLTLLVVALAAPLAAAEAPLAVAAAPAPVAAPASADNAAPLEADLGALPREDFLALLRDAQVGVPKPGSAAPPPCPVAVACTSPIGPCGLSITCTLTNLGPCCTTPSGIHRCCLDGDIIVQKCPCVGPGCPSAQVSFSCV